MENNKLPKWTLENIPLSEVKNLITRTKEVGITTDTILTRVHKAIDNSDNKRFHNSNSLASKDFEDIKKFFEYKWVNFDEENNKDEFFEKQWKLFSENRNKQEMEDIFYLFNIESKKDFINFMIKYHDRIQYYPWRNFSILKKFIKNNDDRQRFINEMNKDGMFAHQIKRLTYWEEFIKQMKNSMDELIFFVEWIKDGESLLNEYYIHGSSIELASKYLPLLDENGYINRNHHLFTEQFFWSFWSWFKENIETIISLYNLKTPEDFSKIYKHFYPDYETFTRTRFHYASPDFFQKFDNLYTSGKIEKEKLIKFFEKYILHNKKNSEILRQLHDFFSHPQLEEILEFFIKNKQKSTFDFFEKIRQFHELEKWLEMDFGFSEYQMAASENIEENIAFEEKMWKILAMNEKEKTQWENALRTKNIKSIKKISTERRMEIFFKHAENKIFAKIYEDFGEVAWENREKIMRSEFLDAYKMSINPRYNKEQFREILTRYLKWDFDNIEEMRQFDTPKNQKWLAENLTEHQQKIWLSKNRKEYNFENHENEKNSFEIEKQHHIRVINDKIREINELGFNFDANITDRDILTDYFLDEIETKRTEITQKWWEYLLADIQFQFESMLEIDNQEKNSKNSPNIQTKHKKIIIEREQDPLRVMMMGNCVNGSCLAFDSSTGNYFSTAANAIDANKAVFYLYNEKNELLGRVLATIWQDQKITRYKMYFAKEPDYSLDKIFNEYFRDLADKMDMRMNGDQYRVQNIESEEWYKDGEVRVSEWWQNP